MLDLLNELCSTCGRYGTDCQCGPRCIDCGVRRPVHLDMCRPCNDAALDYTEDEPMTLADHLMEMLGVLERG